MRLIKREISSLITLVTLAQQIRFTEYFIKRYNNAQNYYFELEFTLCRTY